MIKKRKETTEHEYHVCDECGKEFKQSGYTAMSGAVYEDRVLIDKYELHDECHIKIIDKHFLSGAINVE